MSVLRIVLAEDGYLLRAGICALLEEAPDVEVVAQCADLDSLLEAVDRHRPDVVLTDIKMPPGHSDEGIRAAVELRRTHPGVGVVVLSQYVEAEYALALMGEDATGRAYLLKERLGDLDPLVEALRAVAAGGSRIDPLVVDLLLRGPAPDHPIHRLTGREHEVLGHVARGASNAAIAAELVVTERAVEKHINSILAKLDLPVTTDVHRRVAAVLLYLSATDQRRAPARAEPPRRSPAPSGRPSTPVRGVVPPRGLPPRGIPPRGVPPRG